MTVNETLRSSETNRRKSYLINPAFQWKYALMLGLGVFLTTSILSCVLYATLHEEARQRFLSPHTANLNAGFVILISAFCFSVLTAGTVVALSVITSHRVCGPLFVLEGYFRQLADGRVPTPRPLRKKDEFKEIFAVFVEATERMRADRHRQLETCEQLLACVRQADRGDEPSYSQALSFMTEEIGRLRNEIAAVLGIEPHPVPSDSPPDPTLNESKQPAHAGA